MLKQTYRYEYKNKSTIILILSYKPNLILIQYNYIIYYFIYYYGINK